MYVICMHINPSKKETHMDFGVACGSPDNI